MSTHWPQRWLWRILLPPGPTILCSHHTLCWGCNVLKDRHLHSLTIAQAADYILTRLLLVLSHRNGFVVFGKLMRYAPSAEPLICLRAHFSTQAWSTWWVLRSRYSWSWSKLACWRTNVAQQTQPLWSILYIVVSSCRFVPWANDLADEVAGHLVWQAAVTFVRINSVLVTLSALKFGQNGESLLASGQAWSTADIAGWNVALECYNALLAG